MAAPAGGALPGLRRADPRVGGGGKEWRAARQAARNRLRIRRIGQGPRTQARLRRVRPRSVDYTDPDTPIELGSRFGQSVGWERQPNRRPAAGCTVEAQMSAMTLDQGFGQAQTEPGTLMVAGIHRCDLPKG